MPELAEVSLYARDLTKLLKDDVLLSCSFPNQHDWGSVIIPVRFQRELRDSCNSRLRFGSSGKGLQIFSESRAQPLCEFRLGMTGSFSILAPSAQFKRHCFAHLRFKKSDVYYSDPRRFSRVRDGHSASHSLGGVDLNGRFTLNRTITPPSGYLTRKRINWLLDTGHLTGVGNYMANEALGRMDLSPFDYCKSECEAVEILKMCQVIAKDAVKHGGNSFATGYFSLFGKKGNYIKKCSFYGCSSVPRVLHRGRPVFTRFSA